MKTQIIQLEPHDDTLSVRDKMDWAQTPRILLVWPERGKVLRSRLDLIILDRYCSSHGSQLALLTTDREVIFQADKAGIPVFQSRSDAQRLPWGKSHREFQRQELERYARENLPVESSRRESHPPRKKLPLWARIPLFTIGVLAVMALAAYLLPSAEISVVPETRQMSLAVPIQAQPGGNQITLTGLVPARELVISVEGQLSIPASGSTPIPAGYARGEVVFTNLGDEEIYIPPGTILSTSGQEPVLFRTLSGGSTPPEQGAELTLLIEAFLPGEAGNIAADQITRINLDQGAELTVSNPSATEGGTDIHIPAPTLTDRLKLAGEMTRLLEDKAWDGIKESLDGDDILLTRRLNDFELINEEFSPADNGPGETLWLDKSVQFVVYYASEDDLLKLASDLVKTQYQDSSFSPDLDSIQVQAASAPESLGSENYTWEILVTWEESQLASPDEIIDLISAKPTAEARDILLEQLNLAEEPRIRLTPSWWPRIPALPFRIQIIQGES